MSRQKIDYVIKYLIILSALLAFDVVAYAQINFSDTRPGSVLFYNRYTSNPNNPQQGDTQINLTNVNPTESASIHLYFVDTRDCTVADYGVSLTPSQTLSFSMSDFDPGVQGYLVAVANDGAIPTQFNSLIGSAFIRENDGRQAILPALSFPKLSPGSIEANDDGTFTLKFNGTDYDRLPSALAITSFNSEITDSNTLTIYSPSNNLITGSLVTTSVFTLLFDDAERSLSGSFTFRCYKNDTLTTIFNRGGGISKHVSAGKSGWIKLSSSRPLLGSIISKGPIFGGGYNLPALATVPSYEITVPAGF